MARLGTYPSQPTPPSDQFNDGTVHRTVELPDHLKSFIEDYDRVAKRRRKIREDRRRRERAKRVKTPEERAAEAAALHAETEEAYAIASARGEARRNGTEAPEITERQIKLIDRDQFRMRNDGPPPWVEDADYAKTRFSDGYVLEEPFLVCGKYLLHKFVEKGPLRSTFSPNLQLFVAGTPAAGNRQRCKTEDGDVQASDAHCVLTTGDGKKDRYRQRTKLRGLDNTYLTLLREFTSGFRVEIDATFKSLHVLRWLLERAGLACLPHAIAYTRGPLGEVIHPHLWWFLPDGSEVWFSVDKKDKRCLEAPRKLLQGVVLGITKRLRFMGADIAGTCNFRDGKSPLDPKMSFAVFNETVYPDLNEWSHYVSIKGNRDREIRRAILDDSGLSPSVSESLWHAARMWVWDWLAAECKSGKGPLNKEFRRLGSDRTDFAEWILANLLDAAEGLQAGCTSDTAKIGLLESIANYISRKWTRKSMHKSRPRDVGAAAELVKDLDNAHDRQAAGAEYAHKATIVNTVWDCRNALLAIGAGGRRVTMKAVAELADYDPRTISRHWSKIQDSVLMADKSALWSLVGGHPGNSALPEQSTDLPDEDTYEDDLIARSVVNGELTFGSDDWLEPSQNDVSACLVRGGPGWVAHHPDAVWSANRNEAAAQDSVVAADDIDGTAWDDAAGLPAMHEASLPVEGIEECVAASQEVEDAVSNVGVSIAAGCGIHAQVVPAAQECLLPTEGFIVHGAASQEVEDIVERLMRRLSRLRDAPPTSVLSLAGMDDSYWPVEPAKRVET